MAFNFQKYITNKSEELFEKVKQHREYLHQHPELSYKEYNTMNYISEQLTKIGIKHEKGVAETGVVGIIQGDHHSFNQPCVGLRADIDALPIHEENEFEFASKNEGVMHACGHDVHTAILLGVAEILLEIKDELPHPVKLIFQPGEEKNPGGASMMIKAGCLENPKVFKMYGLHSAPEIDVGEIGTREGLFMASSDEIYINVMGKGGHGARPHEAIDSILVAAEIVTSLQKIVSRNTDPTLPCVLTFGHFEAMGATNIIPEKVYLKGTFRAMNEAWRNQALDQIERQAKLIAEAHHAKAEINISRGYPFLENDIQTTQKFLEEATKWLGKDRVNPNIPLRMGSEDFSYYAQEIPTCFFRLGVKNEDKGIIHGLHTPRFNIDNQALIIGMQMMAMCGISE
ncbi:MAG: M20 family metallopeptidase [Brumimicrobium sp.]